MAAAVILIPEMLSGPSRTEPESAARTDSDAPLKTYTIDLNRSPGATPSIDDRAPPAEVPAAVAPTATAMQRMSENPESIPTEPTQTVPESIPAESSTPPPRTVEEPPQPSVQRAPSVRAPAAATQPQQPAPAIASRASVPTSKGWAVQAGSFASRATAERIVKDLAAQGQSAFVMPVRSGGSTLYRVRIGPFADRAVANETLREVKSRVANAAVVAHP